MAKSIFSPLSFLLSRLALFIFLVPVICFADFPNKQSPTYLGFVYNATDLPFEDEYDYIVVGGGTAGCPLAATLSLHFKVLLLERGGYSHDNPNLMSEDGFLTSLMQTDDFDSPVQAFTSEDGVSNARGRVLGGSSAVNAGFYSRAEKEFFLNSGINFDMNLVNKSYEWVERAVAFRPVLKVWQSTVRDGLLEAGVTPYHGFSYEHAPGTKIGGSTFDGNGQRHTSADLLNYAKPSNIKVALHATVERIILDTTYSSPSPGKFSFGGLRKKQAAVGVVYRDIIGQRHHAMIRSKGEVILSAGAIGTPQLLLLSGIGPRPYLSSWGIPVSHHLPTVGKFLYDNPRNGISIMPPAPLEHSLIQVVGITESGTYIEAASNIIPFVSPPTPIFIHRPSSLYLTVATLMEKISGPLSSGSLLLASTDVRMNPIVRFNYFMNPADLARCVSGLRKIGEVLRGTAMEEFKFVDWSGRRNFRYVGVGLPVDQSNDRTMEEFCRRTVSTIWHYHGGAVVGKVVDGDLRVIGLDALRVVDGSTFSISPGTNPQATVMMLGRYMARRILSERRKDMDRSRPST